MAWANPTRAEVLQVALDTGETVVEAWSAWDKGAMGTVLGPMLHHTGSTWSWPRLQAPTLKTVREGRVDLQNSLCMYYIDYAGVIYCISNRLSWHAGAGIWLGVTDGNGHYAGIEAESDGQQWTAETRESYVRLAASILRKTGNNISYAPRHAEFAPGRKTDFSGMDVATFKNDVEFLRANGISLEDDLLPEEHIALMQIRDSIGAQGGLNTKAEDSVLGILRDRLAPVERTVDGKVVKLSLRQEIADIKTEVLKGLTVDAGDINVTGLTLSDEDKEDIADRVAQRVADRMAQ
jgi:hypothetical protein